MNTQGEKQEQSRANSENSRVIRRMSVCVKEGSLSAGGGEKG